MRGHVLVVDDDADIRAILPMVLESYGYPTSTAADGREALERLRADGETALVLLDLMMPGMSGYEFREAQLADPELEKVPVVVLSGADPAADAAALRVPVVQKPVELDDLLAIVRRYCDGDHNPM